MTQFYKITARDYRMFAAHAKRQPREVSYAYVSNIACPFAQWLQALGMFNIDVTCSSARATTPDLRRVQIEMPDRLYLALLGDRCSDEADYWGSLSERLHEGGLPKSNKALWEELP